MPLSDQKYFSEKIFQLPNTFQCISINDDIKIDHSRLQNKKDVIFGSFNNLSKINDNVIDVWSEILRRIENSKLFIINWAKYFQTKKGANYDEDLGDVPFIT